MVRRRTAEAENKVRRHLLVDGHVHFHSCFNWDVFIRSAAAHFNAARGTLGLNPQSPGCLLMTESAGSTAYRSLLCGTTAPDGWTVVGGDQHSLALAGPRGDTILIVPGRQIVSAENLEVLCAGPADIPDGQPVHQVLSSIARLGGVPVIPWGLGKWWGSRGVLIRDLIDTWHDLPFCLGDNGGRARAFPRPSLFQTAEADGIPVLAGSDPLPLPSQVVRAGSYGFVLDDWTDTPRPAAAINDRLRQLTSSPPTFGSLCSTHAMVQAQLGIRWQRRNMFIARASYGTAGADSRNH